MPGRVSPSLHQHMPSAALLQESALILDAEAPLAAVLMLMVCGCSWAHDCPQMQACGAPPDDIVKEMSPGLGLDGLGTGIPQVPGMPTCNVM